MARSAPPILHFPFQWGALQKEDLLKSHSLSRSRLSKIYLDYREVLDWTCPIRVSGDFQIPFTILKFLERMGFLLPAIWIKNNPFSMLQENLRRLYYWSLHKHKAGELQAPTPSNAQHLPPGIGFHVSCNSARTCPDHPHAARCSSAVPQRGKTCKEQQNSIKVKQIELVGVMHLRRNTFSKGFRYRSLAMSLSTWRSGFFAESFVMVEIKLNSTGPGHQINCSPVGHVSHPLLPWLNQLIQPSQYCRRAEANLEKSDWLLVLSF